MIPFPLTDTVEHLNIVRQNSQAFNLQAWACLTYLRQLHSTSVSLQLKFC